MSISIAGAAPAMVPGGVVISEEDTVSTSSLSSWSSSIVVSSIDDLGTLNDDAVSPPSSITRVTTDDDVVKDIFNLYVFAICVCVVSQIQAISSNVIFTFGIAKKAGRQHLKT